MRISPFVSGIATGAMAGAVVSMVAAGAMLNPSMRRNAKHAAQHLAQIGEPPARFGHTGQRVLRNTRPEGTYRFAGRVPRTARAAVHAIFV